MISIETMKGLAPAHLPIFADLRYDGDGQSASLTEFTAEDARRLRTLYQAVSGLYVTLKKLASRPSPPPQAASDLQRRPERTVAMEAARHGEGSKIALTIFSPSDGVGPEVRFVVQNHVTELQRTRILGLAEADLGRLFLGGLTTGGTGMGLQICADFVVRAFGLKSPQRAIDDGYVGARLIDGTFVVWFHWPRV